MMWRSYSKYKNQRTQYKGISFDSKKECEYYIYLENLEAQGAISELKRQVKFELQPSFKHNGKTIRAINYVADFTFYDQQGKFHIVDAKGSKDTLTETFKIKSKMFLYKYGTEIEIV